MRWILLPALCTLSLYAEDLTLTVVYGNGIPDKVVQTTYTPGMSALEVLQQSGRVETGKTGQYLFVRSIDGVKSQVGKFGWFYLIDGKSVPKTAETYQLKDAKSMTWIYKVEACY